MFELKYSILLATSREVYVLRVPVDLLLLLVVVVVVLLLVLV